MCLACALGEENAAAILIPKLDPRGCGPAYETEEAYEEPNQPPSMVTLWQHERWWLQVRTSNLNDADQESKLMGAIR